MPRKNPPKSAPWVNEAMPSAITTMGVPCSRKSSAANVSPVPQSSANRLPILSVFGSSARRLVSGK